MKTGSPSPELDGFLVVDKPAAWTSHDVVARLRRVLAQRRVGHAGTLDPAATGVLPVAVGAATKVVEYLANASKTYEAEVTFGVVTDSFDADGTVTAIADAGRLNREQLDQALQRFRGTQTQLPPMHSAVKVRGQRLYEAARRGQVVDRQPRSITINTLTLLHWEPPTARLLVDCSKGTYIRSLAHDLGQHLGVGAYLSNLVRMRSGPFWLCQAWTMAELSSDHVHCCWSSFAVHPDRPLEDWPALILDGPAASSWRDGREIRGLSACDPFCRVYTTEGDWLGVGGGDRESSTWRPLKVVPTS